MSSKEKNCSHDLHCIIHFKQNEESIVRQLTDVTLRKIADTVDFRQSQTDTTIRLDEICTGIPKTLNEKSHGFHRWCYQNFTNINRLKRRSNTSIYNKSEEPQTKKRRSDALSGVLFPKDKCIFCRKSSLKHKNVHQPLVKCVTETAAKSIVEAAERKQDDSLLCDILGQDLVAKEAHYHGVCRRNYTRAGASERHDRNNEDDFNNTLDAHEKAFDYLCFYIEENIIQHGKIERMTMLREKYLRYILTHSPHVHNEGYKTCKLKDKIQRHFGSKISFWQPNYHSDLVYSDSLFQGKTVEVAFEAAASEEERVVEAAVILRRLTLDAYKNCDSLPWPPSAKDLRDRSPGLPPLLLNFISHMISEKSYDLCSTKTKRLTNSFAQDLSFALTHGKWTLPKQLLLATTIRHWTGSAELLTLLNRFGHCQSYSQNLELETALCNKITSSNSILPPSVVPGHTDVVHFCWDNFDLNEETPSGRGTTHTAHGIIIHEEKRNIEELQDTQVPITDGQTKKQKFRSVNPVERELTPCYIKGKPEPNFVIHITKADDTVSHADAAASDFLWLLCRIYKSGEVPGWTGWLSRITPTSEKKQSIVDYMVPVNAPVTENTTVQHLLEISQEASDQLHQNFTIVTFDLAVAKKALSIVWQHRRFENVIVRLGVFHTVCALFGALGKKMDGSGFSEIIIESGICASGSIAKVISGKHYNRAMRVHKLVLEGLERLLLQSFLSSQCKEEMKPLLDLMTETPDYQSLKTVAESEINTLHQQYEIFKESGRKGELGKTAQFWLSYMDNVWLILMLIRATKLNDLDLHIWSLQSLCPLFFAFDHFNYARYVPVYLISILNLRRTHPEADELLRNNGFSVCRSEVPASRNAVDITIEQTINRHAKTAGGIIGFSRNYPAYFRWAMTRHSRASYVEATLDMVDMVSSESTAHKDTRPSQIQKSEEDVKSVVSAFGAFTNPFDIENKDELYCLSSGIPAPLAVAQDMLTSGVLGQKAMDNFVNERLVEKKKSFHEPIHRQKLKTFSSISATKKVKSTDNKLVQVKAERNVFAQLVLLSEQHDIDLKKTLSFPLSPVPWALATSDGYPVKTDKAKLLHYLESEAQQHDKFAADAVHIVDGNALLQSLICIPDTFEKLAERVFITLPTSTTRVDFVTDCYHEDSIKGLERDRRGTSVIFLIQGPKTKTPSDWKSFMSCSENKKQLIKVIFDEWCKDKYACRLRGKKLFFVKGEECYLLTSEDGESVSVSLENELSSSQEEADTRIILHAVHVDRNADSTTQVVVRSPDTDVLILLLRFVQKMKSSVLFDTGTGDKRRLLDVRSIINLKGPTLCDVLPAFHSFTGCDSTSAFVRRGKVLPIKLLQSNPEFISTFSKVGTTQNLDDDVLTSLEHFVCKLYGQTTKNINECRYQLFMKKFRPKAGQAMTTYDGIDMSLLPPCRDSLYMHIERVNYQTYIWVNADKSHPSVASPTENGWVKEVNSLKCKWTKGNILPQELTDIISRKDIDLAETGDSDEDEIESLLDTIYDDSD